MRAIKLPNGNLLVPYRADDGHGLIGDAMIEIGPDHPDYKDWLPFAVDSKSHEGNEEAEESIW